MLFALVPLVGGNIVGYWYSRRALQKEVDSRLQALLQLKAKHLEDLLAEKRASAARLVAMEPQLLDRLLKQETSPVWWERLSERLRRNVAMMGEVLQRVSVSNHEGKFLASSIPALVGTQVPAQVAKPVGEEPAVQLVQVGGERQIELMTPLLDRTGEPAGYLFCNFKKHFLAGVLSAEGISGQEQTRIFLASEDGSALSVSGNLMELTLASTKPCNGLPEAGVHIYRGSKRKMVQGHCIASPIPGWWLLAEVPMETALAPLYWLRERAILFILILLPCIVVTARFIVRGIRKPLHHVIEAAQKIGEGNLDVQLEMNAHSEVGILGREISSMAAHLKSSREKLHAYHQEHMEQADRLATLGELTSGIAHELRNPLMGIRGIIQVIKRRCRCEAGLDEQYQMLLSLIDRLNQSTEHLLQFAKPIEVSIAPLSLNAVIEESLGLILRQAEAQGIKIEKRFSRNLPTVHGDAGHLRQAMLNLFINAIQSMPDGGSLTVSTKRSTINRAEGVLLAIEDSGEGIEPDALSQIFKPFFTTKPGGTGLGLSLCRRTVERHGGSIEVGSHRGGGSRFEIRLPLQPPMRPAE
ncbi:MAG: ATP-binding protein [Acidobacteriota bacterium]